MREGRIDRRIDTVAKGRYGNPSTTLTRPYYTFCSMRSRLDLFINGQSRTER